MNTCKTCKHWTVRHSFPCAEILRRCEHPKFVEGVYATFEPDGFYYDYEEGGAFWTGPDFGCIHHEVKE